MDVFISYAREDSASAERLYHELSSLPGVTPWLDSKKLLPGTRWRTEIMDALKTSDLFIILLSTQSVSKTGFIQQELSEALERLKTFPPDRVFVVPARLDECHPKHPELQELQRVDLFPNWADGCALIVKTIRKLMGKPVDTPSAPDDIVIETISSAEVFCRRYQARGEMRGCDAMETVFDALPLVNADLAGSSFVRSQFTACDFRDANLRGVNFEGAVFGDCRFAGADLWGVNFWGADVRGIRDLPKAALCHTNFFRTRLTSGQKRLLDRSPDSLHLGDYATFVEYFSEDVGMGENSVARTFVWLNHRYFRMMLGKDSARVFRMGPLLAVVDSKRRDKSSQNDE